MIYYYLPEDAFRDSDLANPIKEKLVIPLDLNSLCFCETHSLNHLIPECFYRQEQYQSVFETVAKTLVMGMYDWTLFDSFEHPRDCSVNPLYIIMRQLIALYGNCILKIIELEEMCRTYDHDKHVMLECAAHNRTFMPVVDYQEIAERYFNCFDFSMNKDVRLKRGSCAPNIVEVLRYSGIETWHSIMNACKQKHTHDAGEVLVMQNALHRNSILRGIDRCDDLVANVCYVPESANMTPIKAQSVKRAVLRLTNDVFDACKCLNDKEKFIELIEYVYEQYRTDLEGPVSLGLKGYQKSKKSTRRRVVIARTFTKPLYRAFLYRKYLEGDTIVIQEYSDGIGTGAKREPIHTYRSAPIADALLYDSSFSGDYNKKFMQKEVEPLRNDSGPSVVLMDIFTTKQSNTQPNKTKHAEKRIYYVPTNFSGHVRIGPNRELNDLVYWHIQRKILQSLITLSGCRVVYKAHPKAPFQAMLKEQYAYIERLGIEVETRPLLSVISDADVVVSDFLNSGLFECAFIGVPSVYLDFNVRDVFYEAQAKLETKMTWIDCSLKEYDWLTEMNNAVLALCNRAKQSQPIISWDKHYIDDLVSCVSSLTKRKETR